MKLNLPKTATACGLFASGLITGYTVSRMSGPLKKHIPTVLGSAAYLTDFKITPTIPELDTDTTLDDLGLDLAMNE
jgi:hypothetical protein